MYFSYFHTPTKDPSLVTFHIKVNLLKLDFYPILVFKLVLGFDEILELGKGVAFLFH